MRHVARRSAAGRVTSTVVAVVSVLAIVAALVGFVLDGAGDDVDVASDAASTSATPTDAKAGSSDGESSPSASPTAKRDKPAAKKDKPAAKKKPKQDSPRPTSEPAVPSVYVEVYNMTSIDGLAGSKAALLQDAGWQVVGIDNWRGNIPASTVYYPSGYADEANRLADTLGISRVRGAVAPMKFDRLTVILTADAA